MKQSPHTSGKTMSPSASKRSVWRRSRLLVTGIVFVPATVVGVDVGLYGALVSPVAVAVAVAVAATVAAPPAAGDQTHTGAGLFDGRRGQADAGRVAVGSGAGQGGDGQRGGGGR